MGWLKMLVNLNNAEGIREAMRMSYEKHVRNSRATNRACDDLDHHYAGLCGALGSRFYARGLRVPEMAVLASVAPFLAMSREDGVEALAEYVVLQERPGEARRAWLSCAVNRALRATNDEVVSGFVIRGLAQAVQWSQLLEADVRATWRARAGPLV